ncbi:MAG: response regulator [Desulfobacterales bacterium]
MKNIKILLAEDSSLMRKVETGQLRSLGFEQITEAENGDIAIKILRENQDIDLIISDWNMPVKNGYQLLSWVRANPHCESVPFLMATAQGDRKQIRRAVEAGASGIITKPFDAAELKQKIDEVMGLAAKSQPDAVSKIRMGNSGKVRLRVAHIQITDHLILGVLGHLLETGELSSHQFELEPVRMSGWNPVETGLEQGTVDAACVLAPIAMDLFGAGVPIRAVLLAHRNGSIFVRNKTGGHTGSSPSFFQGKSILIPHKMSIHHMLAHRFFSGMGLKLGTAGQADIDVHYEVVPPVIMPDFLKDSPDVAGFIVAEPIGSLAVASGIGETEFLSGSMWENHPCCLVAVRDDFIAAHEPAVYEFADLLVRAGQFMEHNPEKTAEIGVDFLDPERKLGLTAPLLRNVLAEGLSTGDLFPVAEDFRKISEYMVSEMKIGKKIDADLFLDTRFAKAAHDKKKERIPPSPVPESVPKQSQAAQEPAQTNDQKIDQEQEKKTEKNGAGAMLALTEEDRERFDTIRISVDILDQLMNLTGELVQIRNRELLSSAMSEPAERSLSQRLSRVTAQLQETVLQTRMQPIGNIFGKLPRIVRELGKKYGKEAEIFFSGRETEVDRSILDSLALPLVCALRVCCRDSIESPEDRKKAGKSPVGRVCLEACSKAGEIHIRIRDDGRGIDPESVKKSALRMGMRNAGQLADMNEKEILSLLFLPEFSSEAEPSRFSGLASDFRSIKKSMETFNGTAEPESAPGEGTIMHLRLPMTLTIIPSLLVAQGGQCYAIAQMNVEELVCLYDEDVKKKVEKTGNQEMYRLRDQLLPLVRLQAVLEHPEGWKENDTASSPELSGELSEKKGNPLTFAVVRIGNRRFGLIVDRVLGNEDIVVKSMHPVLSGLRIYSGVTVMGDGRVVLILDMEGICHHAGLRFHAPEKKDTAESSKSADRQTVLLFKNGLCEHFALPLPLIRRVERIAAAEIENVGDREFVNAAGVSTRIVRLDTVLTVSPCERKEEMYLILPKFISRPFGILASELIDTASVSGDLNTESHMEDSLLGTAIVRNHLTLFIDIFRIIELAEPDWFAERKKGAPRPEEKKHILLIEDSHFFRRLVKNYLESDQYAVTMAENGEEALGCMEKRKFDLIVSDLDMPVMDGWTFLKKVRKEKRYGDIPAIALTALDSETDQAKARDAGFNGYEIKLNRERLLFNVAKLLRQCV